VTAADLLQIKSFIFSVMQLCSFWYG